MYLLCMMWPVDRLDLIYLVEVYAGNLDINIGGYFYRGI
jgi:hypothetical protein